MLDMTQKDFSKAHFILSNYQKSRTTTFSSMIGHAFDTNIVKVVVLIYQRIRAGKCWKPALLADLNRQV